jgi:hypothetical protein
MEINLRGNLGGCRPIHARSYAPKAKGAERQPERKGYEAALAERQYRRVDPTIGLSLANSKGAGRQPLCAVKAAENSLERQRPLKQAGSRRSGRKLSTEALIHLSSPYLPILHNLFTIFETLNLNLAENRHLSLGPKIAPLG